MKRTIIIGNLTRDSQIKKVGQSDAISFTVAVNEKKKDMPAVFFSCLNFRIDNKLVDILRKSTKVAVAGELTVNVFTNNEGKEQT